MVEWLFKFKWFTKPNIKSSFVKPIMSNLCCIFWNSFIILKPLGMFCSNCVKDNIVGKLWYFSLVSANGVHIVRQCLKSFPVLSKCCFFLHFASFNSIPIRHFSWIRRECNGKKMWHSTKSKKVHSWRLGRLMAQTSCKLWPRGPEFASHVKLKLILGVSCWP